MTAMVKGNSGNQFALKGGDAQHGPLTKLYEGARPNGYHPMKKQGESEGGKDESGGGEDESEGGKVESEGGKDESEGGKDESEGGVRMRVKAGYRMRVRVKASIRARVLFQTGYR